MSRYKVCLYVDDYASLMSTPEEEYEQLEQELRRDLFRGVDVSFRTGVAIKDIPPDCDLYVIDYGGIASADITGRRGEHYAKTLAAKVAEMPSCYFMVWSSFSSRYFEFELQVRVAADDWEDGPVPPNVVLYPDGGCDEIDAAYARLRALLGIPDPAPTPKKASRAKRNPRKPKGE